MRILFLFFFVFNFIGGQASICLNMIVKDEAPVILRCLESVKPLIDYWVIVDTGSTDNTQHLIYNYLKDIPGELKKRPWVNFGHNRNEALNFAQGKADYILFIDADEQLVYSELFQKPHLEKDYYYIMTEYGSTKYQRVQLIKSTLDWKWVGPVHEVVVSSQAKEGALLKNVINLVSTDGNRAQDSQRFLKDAALLEKALEEDQNHTRNVFYLAQSYRDAGEYQKAIEVYKKRIDLRGWDQEVFWSLLQVGMLQELTGESKDTIVKTYIRAFEFRPQRAEPLYRIANLYRREGNFVRGYDYAAKGLALRDCDDILFVENWIYQYGLLLEYSICAYWIEKYHEAFLASHLLLAQEKLPVHIRECVEKNLEWIQKKL